MHPQRNIIQIAESVVADKLMSAAGDRVASRAVDYGEKLIDKGIDKGIDKVIEKDAERRGYDPNKAGKKFWDKPVSAVKGTGFSALTGFSVSPKIMTKLYMKKARSDRMGRQAAYSDIKGAFKSKPSPEEN